MQSMIDKGLSWAFSALVFVSFAAPVSAADTSPQVSATAPQHGCTLAALHQEDVEFAEDVRDSVVQGSHQVAFVP